MPQTGCSIDRLDSDHNVVGLTAKGIIRNIFSGAHGSLTSVHATTFLEEEVNRNPALGSERANRK